MDTTTARSSVALVEEDEILGEVRLASKATHSRHILPAIAFLLDSLGLSPSQVEGYAVTLGPGSFTGLRIGISTVQGLALASGRKVLGLSAFEVLAARIRGSAPWLVAMVDAYRGQVYGALFDREARRQGTPSVLTPVAFLDGVPAEAAFIGDGADRYQSEIRARRPEAIFPERSLYLAATLGQMAASRLLAGEGSGPETLRPIYIREPDIRVTPP